MIIVMAICLLTIAVIMVSNYASEVKNYEKDDWFL